jgi:6-phosphogluconate dehydrogenase
MQAQADIGLIGLAVMGQNLVLNMNDHGFTVAVFNRTAARVDYFGAHTYERIDQPRGRFFHSNWTGRGGGAASGSCTV